MPRASRYFIPGHVWHITHRCHLSGEGEKGTGYFFSLPVTMKPGKSPLCREFLEDNKAATPITLLTAVTVAPQYSINLKTTKPFYRS
jgi:hypothetical protein